MSDIIIPNAKLPINCFTCDYEKLTENCPCHIGISSASEYKNSRHPDCPLKEVLTHGDWHTGTPTEKCDYLVASEQADGDISYKTAYWAGTYWDLYYPEHDFLVVAWQKIEPYKASEGRK